MKVLWRNDWKWHNATYDIRNHEWKFQAETNGVIKIKECNIISVKDDDRSSYVICRNCGAYVENTPEAIAKHSQLGKSAESCLTCSRLRTYNEGNEEKQYVRNNDGSYNIISNVKANLRCGYYYGNYVDIESKAARTGCTYAKCGSAGFDKYQDIFTQYPGAFDTILTVDALEQGKWNLEWHDNTANWFKVAGAVNLYAVVNHNGFIDHFVYKWRSTHFQFMYSAKYEVIVWYNHREYGMNAPTQITETTLKRITKRIKELYKEVK